MRKFISLMLARLEQPPQVSFLSTNVVRWLAISFNAHGNMARTALQRMPILTHLGFVPSIHGLAGRA